MSEINNENELNESNEASDKDVVNAVVEPKVDSLGRSYATGRRKDSTARVWVKRGSGVMKVNGKEMPIYFDRPVLQMQLNHVFEIANRVKEFDVMATVKGGGLSGQAGAVKHGISKALSLFEPELNCLELVFTIKCVLCTHYVFY